jgi:hypothetical protein
VEAIASLVKGGLATPMEARQLLREQVYETLSTDALPEPDDTELQAQTESARKTGVEAIVGLLDGGLVSPEEARALAQRLFEELPDGPPPDPAPEPDPSDASDVTASQASSEDEPAASEASL